MMDYGFVIVAQASGLCAGKHRPEACATITHNTFSTEQRRNEQP